MQPLVHIILILFAWLVCLGLPRTAAVHVLSLIGLAAVVIFAPVAAGFLMLTVIEAVIMVWFFNRFPRKSDIRQYGPYLLLLNLLFVDFHELFLLMPVATLAISFSTIRIFMTTKQLLSSRKALPATDSYWLFPAAFFLPALVIGPVFSGTLLRDQNRAGKFEKPVLRDYRMIALGFLLAVFLSPGFGDAETLVRRSSYDVFFINWILLFLQLFAAFWGQSLIAEHFSRLFGYRLPVNFQHPWKALSFKDFWARWHRSMAQFVLQYIFLPLNLRGVPPKLATVAAFVFMGIWHNLSIGYFVWGVAHGLLLAYSFEPPTTRPRRWLARICIWTIVIFLSWFANYGPLS